MTGKDSKKNDFIIALKKKMADDINSYEDYSSAQNIQPAADNTANTMAPAETDTNATANAEGTANTSEDNDMDPLQFDDAVGMAVDDI